MIVNIFHGVVLSVVLQPILSPGEQGLGIFCNSKQIQICRLFSSETEVGSSVIQDASARLHEGQKGREVCTSMYVRACT